MEFKFKKAINLSFFLFVLFLIWGLYFKFGIKDKVIISYISLKNLTFTERLLFDIVPFEVTHPINLQVLDIVLNGLVFAPLGLLLCLKDNGIKIKSHLLFCFCLSLLIELTQLFTLIGGFATDDLIMNTLGYFIGMIIYVLLFRNMKLHTKYTLFTLFNIVLIIILLFGFIKVIDIFDVYIDILLRR